MHARPGGGRLLSLRMVPSPQGLGRARILGSRSGWGRQTRRRGRRHGAGRRGSGRRWRNRRWRRGRRCRRNWRWRRHGWDRRGRVGRGRRIRRIRQFRSVGCVHDVRLSRGKGVAAPIVWRRAALDIPGRFRLSGLRWRHPLGLLLRIRCRVRSRRRPRRHADNQGPRRQAQQHPPAHAARRRRSTVLPVDRRWPLPRCHLTHSDAVAGRLPTVSAPQPNADPAGSSVQRSRSPAGSPARMSQWLRSPPNPA